jgi:predicted PurR-regulated permease PerM
LVWLAIILALIWIFEGAAFILVHIFNVLLLFVFAGIVALILTPLVDWMERTRPFRGHPPIAVLLIYAVGIAIVAGAIMLVLPTVIAQAKGLPALLQTVENQLSQHGISVSISSLIKAVNGQQLGVAAAFVSGLVSVVLVVVISIICSSRGVRSWRRRATSFRTGSASSTLLR